MIINIFIVNFYIVRNQQKWKIRYLFLRGAYGEF